MRLNYNSLLSKMTFIYVIQCCIALIENSCLFSCRRAKSHREFQISPLDTVLSQFHPPAIHTTYSLKIHFTVNLSRLLGLPSGCFQIDFPVKILYEFFISSLSHTSGPL
jgi:hypothetical protein